LGFAKQLGPELQDLQGDLMELVDGYENENGVFLRFQQVADDLVTMDIKHYSPDHPEFAWALEQLRELEA
jgi:hypothetical protein